MNPRSMFQSGSHLIDPTRDGWFDDLLAFHRRTFGDAEMNGNGGSGDAGQPGSGSGDSGANGDGQGSAQGAAGSGSGDAPTGIFTDPDSGEKYAFPERTPVKDMTSEQQAEYWRHKARKHEGRAAKYADYDQIVAERDQLKAATQTDAEKAIEQAKREAADAAKVAARSEVLPQLVTAKFEVAAAGRIPSDKLATILAPLDLTKFLTADGGEVDTDKVQQYVDGLAPAGGKWPDMGQGRRDPGKTSGVSAGRDLYGDRHKKK